MANWDLFQTYADGKSTMFIHERKASIRQFYGEWNLKGCKCIIISLVVWELQSAIDLIILCSQVQYFHLYCNFKEGLQILKMQNRKRYVHLSTQERMMYTVGNSLKLTQKERKSVEFAWKIMAKLCFQTVTTLCV